MTAPPNTVKYFILNLDNMDRDAAEDPSRSEDCGAGSADAAGSPTGGPATAGTGKRGRAQDLAADLGPVQSGTGTAAGCCCGRIDAQEKEPVYTKFLS